MTKVVQYFVDRVLPSFLGIVVVWVIVSLFILPFLMYRQVRATDPKVEEVYEMVRQQSHEMEMEFLLKDSPSLQELIPWQNDSIDVQVTAYTPTKDQCDDTPFITASNQRVRDGIIALSRDLEEDFGLEFGDTVVLEEIGVFEFQDRMHPRWERKVDIFMWERREALEFGVQETRLFLPKKLTVARNCNS
jgi:3D (Asp-Asp-Asp) domain-containing protein